MKPVKVERRIHRGWKSVNDLPQETKNKIPMSLDLFGKYQYIYTKGQNKISLVHLVAGLSMVKVWEIYQLEGNLFGDVERFRTKALAVKRIKELLE